MRADLSAAALAAALIWPAAALARPAADPASVPAASEADGTRYDLLVVGVYRPLDLEGRTVVEPREVYLQSIGVPEGPLSILIGRTLEVIREVPVPAAVPPPSPASQPATAAPDPSTRPPQPAPEAPVSPVPAPAVTRPGPEPLPTHTAPTPVGRLEVTAVRGEVVVARVIEDGVDGPARLPVEAAIMGPASSRIDLPAVMAGDVARYVEPPPPAPPPPPLSADEQARLDAEKRRLEKDDARRKARPKPYERPVMRWKL